MSGLGNNPEARTNGNAAFLPNRTHYNFLRYRMLHRDLLDYKSANADQNFVSTLTVTDYVNQFKKQGNVLYAGLPNIDLKFIEANFEEVSTNHDAGHVTTTAPPINRGEKLAASFDRGYEALESLRRKLARAHGNIEKLAEINQEIGESITDQQAAYDYEQRNYSTGHIVRNKKPLVVNRIHSNFNWLQGLYLEAKLQVYNQSLEAKGQTTVALSNAPWRILELSDAEHRALLTIAAKEGAPGDYVSKFKALETMVATNKTNGTLLEFSAPRTAAQMNDDRVWMEKVKPDIQRGHKILTQFKEHHQNLLELGAQNAAELATQMLLEEGAFNGPDDPLPEKKPAPPLAATTLENPETKLSTRVNTQKASGLVGAAVTGASLYQLWQSKDDAGFRAAMQNPEHAEAFLEYVTNPKNKTALLEDAKTTATIAGGVTGLIGVAHDLLPILQKISAVAKTTRVGGPVVLAGNSLAETLIAKRNGDPEGMMRAFGAFVGTAAVMGGAMFFAAPVALPAAIAYYTAVAALSFAAGWGGGELSKEAFTNITSAASGMEEQFETARKMVKDPSVAKDLNGFHALLRRANANTLHALQDEKTGVITEAKVSAVVSLCLVADQLVNLLETAPNGSTHRIQWTEKNSTTTVSPQALVDAFIAQGISPDANQNGTLTFDELSSQAARLPGVQIVTTRTK